MSKLGRLMLVCSMAAMVGFAATAEAQTTFECTDCFRVKVPDPSGGGGTFYSECLYGFPAGWAYCFETDTGCWRVGSCTVDYLHEPPELEKASVPILGATCSSPTGMTTRVPLVYINS